MEALRDRLSSGPVTDRLRDKVVLITGAASGQGRCTALLFARAGASVFGSDINESGLEETRELAMQEGLRIETAVADASNPEHVGAWVSQAEQSSGRIDVLYNNGASVHMAPFGDMTLDEWHMTIRFELDVVFVPSQAVWPIMQRQGGGVIINIASTSGILACEELGASAHAAGKGGVIALTRQMAMEGAPHWIRVNSISPGPILTPASEGFYNASARFRHFFDGWPALSRTGRPIDVAYAGLFLASDESSFVTGTNLTVDGGTVMKMGTVER